MRTVVFIGVGLMVLGILFFVAGLIYQAIADRTLNGGGKPS